MECPFGLEQPECDFALECQVLTAALDEAEELRTALNNEYSAPNCASRPAKLSTVTAQIEHHHRAR